MGIKMKIKYFNVANLKFYETFKIKKDKVDIIMNNIIELDWLKETYIPSLPLFT
jgi:helix-turn-helix protein